ncbi:hypothetical protein ONZ43_g3181 [Nemania bipapillata]|uniref:Uncharacterized protein n=1 Tax=Nemania bipapillata TaxID=110536 RepID=A0ACC2IYE6_9PEZI|nr:hypothetical protein ONZ43_g3181 [Nemania bipapillata]
MSVVTPPPTGRTLTPPHLIRESPYGIAEGSHILRRGEYYYLFTAEGGTEAGHQEWVFRSREGVYGPWEAQGKPLWYNGSDEEVQRTGHADVFEDGEGNWWAVFLGVRPVKDGDGNYLEPQMGRESFLVKVDWVDGWPIFNEGLDITLATDTRTPVHQDIAQIQSGDIKWQADLKRQDLELGWYLKNTPLKHCYNLTQRPGYLRLYGNCYDLSSPEAPAMLLRKQSSYTESFEVKMQFSPRKTGYEAGIVVWWSQYSYATYGLTLHERLNGEQALKMTSRLPTGRPGEMTLGYHDLEPLSKEDTSSKLLLGDTIRLLIEATPTTYKLSFKLHSCESTHCVDAKNLTVMPPIGGAFCGTSK